VLEALKILDNKLDQLKNVYLARTPMNGKIVSPMSPNAPKATCFACAPRAQVIVSLDINTKTVGFLHKQISCESLGFVEPEAVKMGPSNEGLKIGSQITTSDEDYAPDYEANIYPKTLASHGIIDGTELEVEDFQQPIKVRMIIRHTVDDLPPEGFTLLKSNMELSKTTCVVAPAQDEPEVAGEVMVVEDDIAEISERPGKRMRDDEDEADTGKRLKPNA